MQYAQGLRQLGCDVYWMEHFRRGDDEKRDAAALATFRARMQRFGLGGKLILYVSQEREVAPLPPSAYLGITQAEAEATFAQADLLLNFHYAINPALLARFRRTALVDIDPGLLQFWISRGQLAVPPHDCNFTTGETVGTSVARFPDCGRQWVRIRPPVCLDHWPYAFDPSAAAFTTVSNWDADDWIVDADETYENTKRIAFLEFGELPRLTSQPLELALYLKSERDFQEQRELER